MYIEYVEMCCWFNVRTLITIYKLQLAKGQLVLHGAGLTSFFIPKSMIRHIKACILTYHACLVNYCNNAVSFALNKVSHSLIALSL